MANNDHGTARYVLLKVGMLVRCAPNVLDIENLWHTVLPTVCHDCAPHAELFTSPDHQSAPPLRHLRTLPCAHAQTS